MPTATELDRVVTYEELPPIKLHDPFLKRSYDIT